MMTTCRQLEVLEMMMMSNLLDKWKKSELLEYNEISPAFCMVFVYMDGAGGLGLY
jgi:hypothetical protein